MRKIFILVIGLSLYSCVYTNFVSPEGVKVTYFRSFMSAENVKGQVGENKIEVKKEKVDSKVLNQLLQAIIAAGVTP